MRKARFLLWPSMVLAFCFSGGLALGSSLHPNLANGYSPNADQFEWDRINLFNGSLGITLPLGFAYPLTQGFNYRLILHYNSNVWSMKESLPNQVSASPNPFCNAGLGWDLSLGRLVDPLESPNGSGQWIYISPDGALHAFFSLLHEDDGIDPTSAVAYTRDGTYHRLHRISSTTCTVESPDGLIRIFTRFADNQWRVTQIKDRFSNSLSITYSADSWRVTDSQGRSHTLYFRSLPSGHYSQVIDRVVLSAFGGTTATYQFEYTTQTVNLPDSDTDPATPTSMSMATLRAVVLPDGSKHEFTYSPRSYQGRLISLLLPTLGKVNWTYQPYQFVNPGCPTGLPPFLRQSVGVASRTLLNPDGSVAGSYSYAPTLYPQPSGASCVEATELRNTVTTPLGHKAVHYFSVNTNSRINDYGLPLARSLPDVGGNRYLSRQYFDCRNAGNGNDCLLVQSVYVNYEQDRVTNPTSPTFDYANRRLATQRTVYHDDVENGEARFADVKRSDFDGVGHYRRVTTAGNFGSGDYGETVIRYEATVGSYPSPGFSIPGPDQPWLLNLYAQTVKSEGGSSVVVDYCFDRQTGFLWRKRLRYDASILSSRDVVIAYQPDAAGEVSREQYYGGDTQRLDTSTLCTLALPVNQYEVRYEYQSGSLRRSQYYDELGRPFGSQLADRVVDQNTGLVQMSKDSAGISVTYAYDAMGNLAWVKPESGQGGWQEHRYAIATAATGAQTVSYQYRNQDREIVSEERMGFDGFGRLTSVTRRLADGSNPSRYRHYNAMGWLTAESEFSTESPRYRSFLSYDPFGRVGTIRPPEGSHHDTTFTYKGVRSVTTTAKRGVAYHPTTGQIREEPISTTELFDRQGRSWKTIAPQSSGDEETVYSYDVVGRLLETRVNGSRVGVSRSYDGRGFLRQSVSGSETTDHESTDALGKSRLMRRTNSNGTGDVSLAYDYDRAGQLIRVRDREIGGKVWKEFFYADTNGVMDWRAGKLWKTVRYNDMSRFLSSVGVAQVSESYTYGGVGGKVSEYTIKLQDQLGRQEKFQQTYRYDEQGRAIQIGYPSTASSPENTGVTIPRDRSITNLYSWGQLVQVADSLNRIGATSITYHAN